MILSFLLGIIVTLLIIKRGDPMAYTKANLKRLRAIIREGKVIVARIEAKVKGGK